MRLSYRTIDNTLRLTLDEEQGVVHRVVELPGTLDIGEQGRLVGIELPASDLSLATMMDDWMRDPVAARYVHVDGDSAYVTLSAPGETIADEQVRSATVRLGIELDQHGSLVAISIPRKGHGYEISFPSGNR